MKKVLGIVFSIIFVTSIVIYFGLSGLDGIIRDQIEAQGTKATKTNVTVEAVETKLAEAKVSIDGLKISNPRGYTQDNAFSMDTIRLDLGTSTEEPYVIEELLIDSPAVLYEVDSQGKANLTVIQENIQASLPQSDSQPEETSGESPNPLMSVKKITVKDVTLRLNIAAMDLGELPLEKRQFELTLPTFYADAIGVPNGIPADQLGSAIVDSMLDNLIAEGKRKVTQIFEDEAKAKAKEKLEAEKKKLEEKAKNKLKDLIGG